MNFYKHNTDPGRDVLKIHRFYYLPLHIGCRHMKQEGEGGEFGVFLTMAIVLGVLEQDLGKYFQIKEELKMVFRVFY